jgi:hypothetical protein
MRLLSLFFLTTIFSVTFCSTDESASARYVLRTIAMEEMQEFVNSLTFDDIISILGLARKKRISPYSMLDMKLQLFFIRLERLSPELDDFYDENDVESDYFLYQLHAMAYERAWDLLQVMPHAEHTDYYRAILMEQVRPREYAQQLENENDERARIAHLFVG